MNCLKIAVWNANGLAQRSLEVSQFMKDNNISIMLVSETHFTNKTFFKINNFEIHCTNHPAGTARGGSAIIIDSSINHEVLSGYQTHHIQATNILISDKSGSIAVSALYSPPRHAIKHEQYEEFFNTLGPRFIVGGDFNAKHPYWGCRTFNPKGRELFKCIQAKNRLIQTNFQTL